MVYARRSAVLNYVFALLFSAAAAGLTWLTPLRTGSPFLLPIVAVLLSARYGGWGPGLLATLLGMLANVFLFLTPSYLFNLATPGEILVLVVFVSIGIGVTWLTAAREQAKEYVRIQVAQQAAVAGLGQQALAVEDVGDLLQRAAQLVCDTLHVEFCKVLELEPGGQDMLLRAGCGWKPGYVGSTHVSAGLGSQAGYTLLSQEPVIVKDLAKEKRFSSPPLLVEHGVRNGVSVIIPGRDKPFGVLGAYSARRLTFNQDDIHFLQSVANVLAMAIGRVRNEEEVRDSEERHRAIAETAKDGIVTIDADDRIVFVNPAAVKIFGYSNQELAGKDFGMLVPGERREKHGQADAEPPATGDRRMRHSGVEQTGIHKDGKHIPLEISFGEYVQEGKRYFTGVIRDITERRAAEEQLRFQASVLRNVRDGVVVTDDRGKILFWNQGATAIFGYTAEEMMGRSIVTLYPDEKGPLSPEDLARVRAGEEHVAEWKGRCKDGRVVWVNIKTTAMRDAAGKPISFIGVAADITERKRAEELAQAQHAVTQALAEAETIEQATPRILEAICTCAGSDVGAIWSLDTDADVLRCLDVWSAPDAQARDFESLTREILFLRDVGLPGQVWSSRRSMAVQDIAHDPSFARAKVALKDGLRAASAFPIITGGQFAGVLEFYSRQAREPDAGLADMIDALTSQIGQFIRRKRAEQALRLSEEQQSIILQGVADGITLQDATGRLIFANRGAAHLLGYRSPEELINAPIKQVLAKYHLEDENGAPLMVEQLPGRVAIRERKAAGRLVRFRDIATGAENWSQVDATPILDEQGRARFAINIFHDVTERRRAEEAVREQRELLRVTLSSIGDAVISTDTRGRITFLNPVAEALTGWALDDAIHRPLQQIFNIVSEETNVAVENPVTRVMREQAVVGLANHTLLIAKDGKRIPIDDSAAPIRDSTGSIIGIVLVFRDVTDRRRTDREVSRLASIVKSSEDAIESKTLEGILLTWNPAAERLFGYKADEVIGKPAAVIYPPERQAEFEHVMERLRQGQSIDHYDTVRLAKDGRRIDVSVSISLIRDAGGRVLGASTIMRDITERKRAEDAARFLAQASDVLSSSLDYETTLASVAQLAVPEIADWCAVDVKAEDGSVKRLALAHVDPAKLQLAQEYMRRYAPDPTAGTGLDKVLATGEPDLVAEIPGDVIARVSRDPEQLKMLLDLGLNSYMIVPMIARGRTLGAISFVLSDLSRHYGAADLELARDLARRAAFAVDNARLYREAQTLNEELEQRVARRTIELQNANRTLEGEIAARKRMTDQLRLLSGYLQSAREEERIRIAREIHDEIGQVLTAVKMDLSLLGREVRDSPSLSHKVIEDDLHETTEMVDGAIQTMHNIVRELRPEVLDHLGLRAALEWQLQEFQSRMRIKGELISDLDDVQVDSERSTAVFRILQETLTNVARHAEATEVQACLKLEDHQLVLEVKDNGKGISDEALSGNGTFGILGMRERARVFGGEVTVQGEPDVGTVVTARIPL